MPHSLNPNHSKAQRNLKSATSRYRASIDWHFHQPKLFRVLLVLLGSGHCDKRRNQQKSASWGWYLSIRQPKPQILLLISNNLWDPLNEMVSKILNINRRFAEKMICLMVAVAIRYSCACDIFFS